MERWTPRVGLSPQEKLLIKRLVRVRTLFAFFRLQRHQLFDDGFQEQLESMYRTTGAGLRPHAPDMDRMLLERTVTLVRSGVITEGEKRAVSKALRIAVDSRPLAGAGRVEDAINLLGHAARSIVDTLRLALQWRLFPGRCHPRSLRRPSGNVETKDTPHLTSNLK
jgi:hypothetical protein